MTHSRSRAGVRNDGEAGIDWHESLWSDLDAGKDTDMTKAWKG